MIEANRSLPRVTPLTVEYVKIKCLFDAYREDESVLFWRQTPSGALLSLADGNLTVCAENADFEELKAFIAMLSPRSVFASLPVFHALGLQAHKEVHVMRRTAGGVLSDRGDELDSREIYELLHGGGLDLPPYPDFAVDLCHRLNRGLAHTFGIRGICAAVCFASDDAAVMHGIASRQKGNGSLALRGLLAKTAGKEFFVCCRTAVKGFYEKNGFEEVEKAGYWNQ